MSIDDLIDVYNQCEEKLGGLPWIGEKPNRQSAERNARQALSKIIDPAKRPGKFGEGKKMQLHSYDRNPSRDIRFSQRETDLLDLMPKDGSQITTLELVELYYG